MLLSAACLAGGSQVPPYTSADSARALLVQSAEAIGGVERLSAIRAVRVGETGYEYQISTRTRADLPPRLTTQTIFTFRDHADSGFTRELMQNFPTRPRPVTSRLIARPGVVAQSAGNRLVAASAFDLATSEEELELAPERVLLTALAASDVRVGRDTTIAGAPYRSVTFSFHDGQARLYLDARSHFPNRLALVREYPTMAFWSMWGPLHFETTWSAWSMEANGAWYPRQRTTTFNGRAFRMYAVSSLDLDASPMPDSLAIPDSVSTAFRMRLAAERAAPAPSLTPVTIASGVVLYQGGYQSLAVQQDDGILVIEAPESDRKSRAVLADLAVRFPGLPIKAVVSTSPMWSHIGGLREYALRRIPIYLLDANAGVVRELLSAGANRSGAKPAVIRAVSRPLSIGSGTTRIELRPARGQQGANMMIAYLPSQRLLYASDLVTPPAFEPPFNDAYRAELLRIVQREGLNVSQMVSLHLPLTRWSDVVAPRTP